VNSPWPDQPRAREEALLAQVPAELRRFYSASDGFVTPLGVSIYGLADLAERNDTYEIPEYCAGFLLIGDDSGGIGFLVALCSEDTPVFSSDLGDLDPAGFVRQDESLADWLARLTAQAT
jgi:hypothetical protein